VNYNYHTHTSRCGHATGTAEEYVITAIENGIKHMGFSDHLPLRFSDGTESHYRVPACEAEDYCKEILSLSAKYKDKIDLKVGFESEYYPELFDEMLENAVRWGAEYLILGQHYTFPENEGARHTVKESDSREELAAYTDSVIAAMRENVFSYIAHPDVFNFTGDADFYRGEARRLCAAAREMNVPLEINFLGIRGERHYPREDFWKVAGEEKAPVTFGFDAHEPESAFDKESLAKAERMVKKYNLNYIGKPELILIRDIKT